MNKLSHQQCSLILLLSLTAPVSIAGTIYEGADDNAGIPTGTVYENLGGNQGGTINFSVETGDDQSSESNEDTASGDSFSTAGNGTGGQSSSGSSNGESDGSDLSDTTIYENFSGDGFGENSNGTIYDSLTNNSGSSGDSDSFSGFNPDESMYSNLNGPSTEGLESFDYTQFDSLDYRDFDESGADYDALESEILGQQDFSEVIQDYDADNPKLPESDGAKAALLCGTSVIMGVQSPKSVFKIKKCFDGIRKSCKVRIRYGVPRVKAKGVGKAICIPFIPFLI